MYIPNWQTEKKYFQQGYSLVVGIDEAGRGPLAGPVVASAVALKNNNIIQSKDENEKWNLIRDSKTLSPLQRKKALHLIHENFWVGVGIINEKTIDRINILEATFLAMKSALSDLKTVLKEQSKHILLVDGGQIIPNLSLEQKAIKKGDQLVKTIAGASIVAKLTRDEIMEKYAKTYPQYGFEKHKGYGTKMHLEALQKYGASSIHRLSFKPVKKVVDNISY